MFIYNVDFYLFRYVSCLVSRASLLLGCSSVFCFLFFLNLFLYSCIPGLGFWLDRSYNW